MPTDFREPVRQRDDRAARDAGLATPIDALMPIFSEGRVAIIVDGDRFLGLITRIDVLNYLRRTARH